MIVDFTTVLKTIDLIGSATPAFKALFDAVMVLFSEEDQEKLKEAYKNARARSDEAHENLQDAAKDR